MKSKKQKGEDKEEDEEDEEDDEEEVATEENKSQIVNNMSSAFLSPLWGDNTMRTAFPGEPRL